MPTACLQVENFNLQGWHFLLVLLYEGLELNADSLKTTLIDLKKVLLNLGAEICVMFCVFESSSFETMIFQ